MKALILSAGQGKRLLPLTAECPKCILPIQGRTMIEWQIDELAKCGIDRVTVVLGYRADKVEKILSRRDGPPRIQTIYNAAYAVTDNLVSCWVARNEMCEDFVLLNGDTLFEAPVLKQLLEITAYPVTVTVSHKAEYDDDDMKVELDGCRLIKIGKDLKPDRVNAESIGMIAFRDEGPMMFRTAIEDAMRNPSADRKWYLSVIDKMAQTIPVWTCSTRGLKWCEVDYHDDLKQAEKVVAVCCGNEDPKQLDRACRLKEQRMV